MLTKDEGVNDGRVGLGLREAQETLPPVPSDGRAMNHADTGRLFSCCRMVKVGVGKSWKRKVTSVFCLVFKTLFRVLFITSLSRVLFITSVFHILFITSLFYILLIT